MKRLMILWLAAGLAAAGDAVAGDAVPPAPRTVVTVSVEAVIEPLVRQLGADSYETRERATEMLRQIGASATAALEKAAKSDDPEVHVRASQLMGDIRLGIGPDWPSEIAVLVRHYAQLENDERRQALERIGQALGAKAVAFLVQRMGSDDANEAQYAFYALQRFGSDEARQVLTMIKEPAGTWPSRAVAWARARLGESLTAPPFTAVGQQNPPPAREAVEAGVKRLQADLRAHKYAQAAAAARELAKAAPEDPRFVYLEAEALTALGNTDEAKTLYERAFAMNSDTEPPHAAAALMLEEMGRRRLAAHEWEAILKIPPADSVYDVNANLHLGYLYLACGVFDKAGTSLKSASDLLAKTREAGRPFTLTGGTEDELRAMAQRYLRRGPMPDASRTPQIEDELGEDEIRLTVETVVKEGKAEELRSGLAAAEAVLSVDVQPRDLRLFDKAGGTLRFDPGAKELAVAVAGVPCGKPVPFNPKAADGNARVAIESINCYYLYDINVKTGEARPAARYEMNYKVSVKPGPILAAAPEVKVVINGKRHEWAAVQEGVLFDRLPDEWSVVVEALSPSGGRLSGHRTIDAGAPLSEPQNPAAKPGRS